MSAELGVILMPLVFGLLQVGIIYLFKIPLNAQKQQEAIERILHTLKNIQTAQALHGQKMESLEGQKQVSQRLMSDLVGVPVDYQAISQDWGKYPRVPKFAREKLVREKSQN